MDEDTIIEVLFRKMAEEEVHNSEEYSDLIDAAVNRLENSDFGDEHREGVLKAIDAVEKSRRAAARKEKKRARK